MIKITTIFGDIRHINPNQIVCVSDHNGITNIICGHISIDVKDSVDEVLKMINEAEAFPLFKITPKDIKKVEGEEISSRYLP